MRGSGPRGDLVVKNSIEEVVHLSPSTFMEFDVTTILLVQYVSTVSEVEADTE